MGRFASTVEFYSRYREPYSARFFPEVAHQLAFHGTESLLDIGCGPAPLAIGFAPFVNRCTGLDPEPAMLDAARHAAANAGISLALLAGRLEDLPSTESFDILSIGRALHWLDRQTALPRLERLTAPGGKLLICAASSIETENTLWVRSYNQLRHAYTSESDESRYRIDARSFFAESPFHHLSDVTVNELRSVTIDDLVGRALSRSNTSPEVLGDRRDAFENEIREVLQPFAQAGVLHEEIVSRASVFQSRATS